MLQEIKPNLFVTGTGYLSRADIASLKLSEGNEAVLRITPKGMFVQVRKRVDISDIEDLNEQLEDLEARYMPDTAQRTLDAIAEPVPKARKPRSCEACAPAPCDERCTA